MRVGHFDVLHVRRSSRSIELRFFVTFFVALPGRAKPGFYKMASMKEIFKMNANIKKGLVAVGALVVAGSALAADDAGVTAINGLAAQATTYISAAFAVAVLVAGGFWGIKMMKKAFGKAG